MVKQTDLLDKILKISGVENKRQLSLKVDYNPTNITNRFNGSSAMKLEELIDWCDKLNLTLNFKSNNLSKQLKSQSQFIKLIQDLSGSDNLNQLTEKINEAYSPMYLYSTNKRKLGLKKVSEWSNLLKFKLDVIKK